MGDELKFGEIFGQDVKNFWKSEGQGESKSRNSEKTQPRDFEASEISKAKLDPKFSDLNECQKNGWK